MKKVLTILMAVLMIAALSACSKPSESESVLYEMPDFSIPPTAVGSAPVVSLETMIQYLNDTKKFTVPFATYLTSCKQTLYTKEDFSDGKAPEKTMEPLGVLTYIFDSNNFELFVDVTSDDFEMLEDGKIAKIKEGKGPATYMDVVVTDLCLDLTDKSCIIRGMYVRDTTTQSAYFVTFKLTYESDQKYTLHLRTEDYGIETAEEYRFVSDETLTCITNQWQVMQCEYKCIQDTSLVANTTNDGEQTIKKQAERLSATLSLTQTDNIYHVNRQIEMKQVYDSYDVNDAEYVYDVTQTIQYKDGKYLLTETANFKNEKSEYETATQFAVFEEKA